MQACAGPIELLPCCLTSTKNQTFPTKKAKFALGLKKSGGMVGSRKMKNERLCFYYSDRVEKLEFFGLKQILEPLYKLIISAFVKFFSNHRKI